MVTAVPPRSEVKGEFTWNAESIFSSNEAWEEGFDRLCKDIPKLEAFRGRLAEGPDVLADWFEAAESVRRPLGLVLQYASMHHAVDTADQEANVRYERARSLFSQVATAISFADPEILKIGTEKLRSWLRENPRLKIYEHYIERLERRRPHVRSEEVEQLLGMVMDPFATAASTHRVLADTDMKFAPAQSESGEKVEIAQGNLQALLSSPDRKLRKTAWENYADAHLAVKNTLANALSAGVKQDWFNARTRNYPSSIEASLDPHAIPVEVFDNLITTFRKNIPTWHRYWKVRRETLGYDKLYAYDIFASLTPRSPVIPYGQSIDWIVEGMGPLGDEYVRTMEKGLREERWVDVYPNQNKTSGAFSSGTPGSRAFILMSYNDDIFSLSTLAHELGHSMHSSYTFANQPFVYSRYGMFVAEVASNFNQALVRAYLMKANPDPNFQIALIEEAMRNFHRYFFIMPTLARFEREIHERVERGEGLSADGMIALMSELFGEGYGDELEVEGDREGITWAEFSHHMYMNFYVFQYATGISAANALAQGVLNEGEPAAERYIAFLKAGGSMYPLDALKLAGVDMTSPEPVQKAFDVLAGLVDRLAQLTGKDS